MGWSSAAAQVQDATVGARDVAGSGTVELDREALYRAHVDFVVGLLSRGFGYRVGGEPRFLKVQGAFDLEDLTQEAFVQLFRQIEKGNFDAERPVRPYLGRIATNLALRRFRYTGREIPYEELDVPVTAEDCVENEECRTLIETFRGTLSARERDVLEAYYETEGATQASAGEALDLSRDQVARSVTSIRKKAIRYFKKRGWFE